VESDALFSDIDGMLLGLTAELDEMLKLQGWSGFLAMNPVQSVQSLVSCWSSVSTVKSITFLQSLLLPTVLYSCSECQLLIGSRGQVLGQLHVEKSLYTSMLMCFSW